jgi:hypothetical protein
MAVINALCDLFHARLQIMRDVAGHSIQPFMSMHVTAIAEHLGRSPGYLKRGAPGIWTIEEDELLRAKYAEAAQNVGR